MEPIKQSNAAVSAAIVADLARQVEQHKAQPKQANYQDAAPYVILRNENGNERIEWLRDRLDDPTRKTGTVKLNDAESFILYYSMHGNNAPVYATLLPAVFIAVLNDHTKDKAGWRDHRAEFKVAHSTEWEMWTKHSGAGAQFNTNESFALFLEENALDIVKPEATRMLEIALNFKITGDVAFSTAQRLQDGNNEFAFSNTVNASSNANGGKIKIPEQFTIEVPVFAGLEAKRYKLEARFRFRLREGKLSLWYELIHPRKAEEQAFKDLLDQIKKGTKAPLLVGTP